MTLANETESLRRVLRSIEANRFDGSSVIDARACGKPGLMALVAAARAEQGGLGDAAELAQLAAEGVASAPLRVLLARLLRIAGDVDGAMREVERAAREATTPTTARAANTWLIEIARSLGRRDELLGAIRLHGDDADPLLVAGALRTVYDREASARAIDAAARGAHTVAAWRAIADAYEKIERRVEASDALEHAVALDPEDAFLRADAARALVVSGKFERASVHLEASAPHSAEARLLLATLHLWRGDLDAALETIRTVHEPSALASRIEGTCTLLRGEPARAVELFDRSIALDPSDPETWVVRGEAKLRVGDAAGAFDDLVRGSEMVDVGSEYVAGLALRYLAKKAVRNAPAIHLATYGEEGSVDAIARLAGCASNELGQSADATAALERALNALGGNRSVRATVKAVGPDGAVTLRAVPVAHSSRTMARFAQRRILAVPPSAALSVFDEVFAAYPASPIPYCYRGEVSLWLGEFDRAGRDFDRALEISAHTFWAMIGLATIALVTGDPRRALAICDRAVESTGRTGPTLFAIRGEAHFRAGNLDAALADLGRACRERDTRIGSFVTLTLLHLARGDSASAASSFAPLRSRARGLLADAARIAGAQPWRLDADSPSLTAVLEEMLRMLRGNRSSSLVTYFTREGAMRFVPLDRTAWGERIDASEIAQVRRALENAAGLTRSPTR